MKTYTDFWKETGDIFEARERYAKHVRERWGELTATWSDEDRREMWEAIASISQPWG